MGTLNALSRDQRVRVALHALCVLGLVLRLIACALDAPAHPDEYFQYLEPAWWHLTGVGQSAWEWRDGIRSWFLPFYNGAWIALLLKLGVPAGATVGWLLKAHWALINTALVPLAYRGGAHVERTLLQTGDGARGGLLAAAGCAALPVLVSFAGHTLSETPSLLCMVAALVLCAELLEDDAAHSTRSAALVGVLLSLGVCLRIASGPLALVAPLWLLARRRHRLLAALAAGALLPVLVFGLVDAFTWGSFGSSFVAYVKFNVVDGKAARYGTEPADWYARQLFERAPLALPLLLVPALVGLRATWPFLGSSLGLLALLSTQPHKEERFVLAFWPFLMIAGAGAFAWTASRLRGTRRRASPNVLACAVWLALVVYGGTSSLHASEQWLGQQDRLDALAWAGRQDGITGLIADMPYTGGAFWFGAEAPTFMFVDELLQNPVVTHAVLPEHSSDERAARAAGFAPIHRTGHYVVLRRR